MTTTTPTTPTTGNTTTTIADALRQILAEVTPGQRPFSSDSYLPDHLVDLARAALDQHQEVDLATQQRAFNALSVAAWHCARGELPQALARMRRAKAHITAAMEVNHG